MKIRRFDSVTRCSWSCCYWRLGKVFSVHWHVGFHENSRPGDPRLRLRGVHLFGWLIPLPCYYVD
jgi:hypothetical protein